MEAPPTRSRLGAVLLRTQPDARLVGLARDGHDVAVEEIVRRYRPALVAFAAGIVPAHHAEDVVQESLTKALQALRGSSAEIALRPWLYTIVRNGALNDLRNERGHEPLNESIDGVPQPHEIAVRRGELAATVAAIKDLPEAQREALVQRELEGRSHEEIAASLGASTGAVRQLIFRARTSLRGAAGVIVPTPVLRYLVAGGSAGALAAGGGGIALKAGTALVVGALVVGSGVALHAGQDDRAGTATAATSDPPPNERHARAAPDSGSATLAAVARRDAGEGSIGSGDDGTSDSGSDVNSGSGSSGSGSSGTVQPPSGASGTSGDDFSGGSGGGHGEPEPADDQGGSGGSGDDGGGSGGSGSGDDGGASSSGDEGGTSGDSGDDSSTSGDSSDDSGDSGDSGSGDEVTTESDPAGG